MTDKPTPTPTDAELEALLLDKLPASKHYIRPVIEKMVAAMQAAIDKWGTPAPVGVGEVAERYRNAIASACEGWTMPDGLRKHLEAALWSPPTPQPTPTTHPADSVQEDAARVFTYKNQPCNNVTAWRFGEACRAAQPGGDPIDHGLSLLQKLQERGYGIVAIDATRKQGGL